MKKSNIILLITIAFTFVACGSNQTNSKHSDEKTVKELDKNTYLGSRVNAIDLANKAVEENAKIVAEQNKLLEKIK